MIEEKARAVDLNQKIDSLQDQSKEVSETRQRIRRHLKSDPTTNYVELELNKAHEHLQEAGKHIQDYIEMLQHEIEKIEMIEMIETADK